MCLQFLLTTLTVPMVFIAYRQRIPDRQPLVRQTCFAEVHVKVVLSIY